MQQSKVIGTGETGVKVNGKKHWFWTWQNPKLTNILHSNNRGSKTIKTTFPKAFPKSTLVNDGWKAQAKTKANNHQTCLPYLQRQLNYL
jgi:transposase